MRKFAICEAVESEVKELQIIGKQTFIESFGNKNEASDMELYLKDKFSLPQLLIEIKNPDSQFYFLKENEKIVGYLKLNKAEAQTEKKLLKSLEIERIYILAYYQGKGLGNMLFKKAIELAKQEGIKTVWLGVWEKNLRAIKFYKKKEFIEFYRHKFLLGKDEQTDIMMKLDLS